MDNTGVVLLVAAIAGSVFLLWVILRSTQNLAVL